MHRQMENMEVDHRNESEEERRRRLKGKAIMTSNADTLMQQANDTTSTALLIGRNTIIIKEPSARVPSKHNLLKSQEKSSGCIKPRQEEEITGKEKTLPSHGILEVGDEDLLNEEQAKLITLTEEEEAEVDKLTSKFDGVIMDDNMMENDDLLVDDPGYEAEQIEAISQLSPMIIQDDNMGDESDNDQQLAKEVAQEAAQEGKELDRSGDDTQQTHGDHQKVSQQPARVC